MFNDIKVILNLPKGYADKIKLPNKTQKL